MNGGSLIVDIQPLVMSRIIGVIIGEPVWSFESTL